MSYVEVVFTSTGKGFPLPAEDGATVSGNVPDGCVLRRSTDFVTYSDAAVASPFVHSGTATSYRIDCDIYTEPVTAVLTIQ